MHILLLKKRQLLYTIKDISDEQIIVILKNYDNILKI